MERRAVVELVAGEEDEVVHGLGRVLGEQLADDLAARGLERRGVLLVGSIVSWGGWGIVSACSF